MTGEAASGRSAHLPYLDGLRGTASAWVLLYHIALLNAVQYPVLKEGPSAVDLFMVLSGFLMAFHYLEREGREPWQSSATWKQFWIRRFFRIAPVYYLLLAVALITGPWISEARNLIGTDQWQAVRLVDRYTDQSLLNLLSHVSFTFGFLPRYSYEDALPDWSIGLEMQFYIALPFLMLLWKRVGPLGLAASGLVASLLVRHFFPSYVAAFVMPSMLTMKLHVFVAGMLLAAALRGGGVRKVTMLVATAIVLPLVAGFAHIDNFRSAAIQTILIGLFACLVFHRQAQRFALAAAVMRAVIAAFDSRFMRWLGDTSYSVYLLHLLIVIPVVGLLFTVPGFAALHGSTRVLLSAAIAIPPVYLVAYLLHRFIERPGIALGKRALSRRSGPQIGPKDDSDAVVTAYTK